MKIAICDDNKTDRALLKKYLFRFENEQNLELVIDEYSSAEELTSSFERSSEKPAIVLLDIYMDKMSGVDAAELIYKSGFSGSLIFATSSQEHAVLSYEIGADGYLKKPFKYESFVKTMQRCSDKWESSLKMLTVFSNRLEFNILLQKIDYIESCAHGSIIHANGQRIKTRKFLSELETSLNTSTCFIRCGRSFIVNMNSVCERQENDSNIKLKNGDKILIPVRERVHINSRIAEYYWTRVREQAVF